LEVVIFFAIIHNLYSAAGSRRGTSRGDTSPQREEQENDMDEAKFIHPDNRQLVERDRKIMEEGEEEQICKPSN